MRRAFLTIAAFLGWFAIICQFILIIANRVASVLETTIRYFSFFTILTNILVAYCFTVLLMKPQVNHLKFFSQPKTLTAITVYITLVGIVYNTILRFIWEPSGLQLLVDQILHTVIPLLTITYWVLFVPKIELRWGDVLPWLLYPVSYLAYVLFRGALSGFYPYPFIDVEAIGYNKVFLNSAVLCIAFLFVSLLMVAVAKTIRSKIPDHSNRL